MAQDVRAAKILNSLTNGTIIGDSGSTISGGITRITTSYELGNSPDVVATTSNGTTNLHFTLVAPIVDPHQFGVTLSEIARHHIVDSFDLTSTATTTITLTDKPNSCPVIVLLAGKSYAEVTGDDSFSVDRTGENGIITWKIGSTVPLSTTTAPKIYVHYEISKTLVRHKENITLSGIVRNSFTITNTPNSDNTAAIINGVVYFEERNDFSVDRTNKRVTWNPSATGFNINSGTLSGYLTFCYNTEI